MRATFLFARWRGVRVPRLLPPATGPVGQMYPDLVEWWVVRAVTKAAARRAIEATRAAGELRWSLDERNREEARVIERGYRPTKEAS